MKVVSIVMPVYNAAKNLNKTLNSVQRQTYKHWELIAVDDCSDDNSSQLLQNFKSNNPDQTSILKSSSPKSGASVCRNIGWRNAKGSYIVFLDSDDLLEPFCLQQRVAVMENEQHFDYAVFNQYEWFSEKRSEQSLYNKLVTTKEESIMHFLKMDSPWQTMAVVWKKETIEQLNGFDESLYFMEDPDLHLRALLENNLTIAFKTQLPPDCFYRMPDLTAAKAETFYNNSINSRFVFLKKTLQLLSRKASKDTMKAYQKYLRNGFITFVKVMLAKRLTNFKQQFDEMLSLLKERKILSSIDLLKLRLLKFVFTHNSPLIKTFRLKGLVYHVV